MHVKKSIVILLMAVQLPLPTANCSALIIYDQDSRDDEFHSEYYHDKYLFQCLIYGCNLRRMIFCSHVSIGQRISVVDVCPSSLRSSHMIIIKLTYGLAPKSKTNTVLPQLRIKIAQKSFAEKLINSIDSYKMIECFIMSYNHSCGDTDFFFLDENRHLNLRNKNKPLQFLNLEIPTEKKFWSLELKEFRITAQIATLLTRISSWYLVDTRKVVHTSTEANRLNSYIMDVIDDGTTTDNCRETKAREHILLLSLKWHHNSLTYTSHLQVMFKSDILLLILYTFNRPRELKSHWPFYFLNIISAKYYKLKITINRYLPTTYVYRYIQTPKLPPNQQLRPYSTHKIDTEMFKKRRRVKHHRKLKHNTFTICILYIYITPGFFYNIQKQNVCATPKRSKTNTVQEYKYKISFHHIVDEFLEKCNQYSHDASVTNLLYKITSTYKNRFTKCGRRLPRNLLWGPIRVQFWLWWRRPAKVPEIYNVYLYTTTIAFVILCPTDVFFYIYIYIIYIYNDKRGPHIAEIVNKANVLLYCRGIIN
ncbi:hypothetical protein AGLY_009614, partial [Aphis glycines]